MNMLPEAPRAGGAPAGSRNPRSDGAAPETLAEMLEAGCLELNISIGQDECERLLSYLDLMQRWNRVYNLTAIRDPRAMLVQHVLDSLAILGWLDAAMASTIGPDRLSAQAPEPVLLDVGTGAGLPGLVLAIARPTLAVDLVEPVGKKAAFLRQCVAHFGFSGRVRVHDERVEAVRLASPPRAIICRAFASLDDYVAAIRHLAGPQTRVAAMKGRLGEIEAEGRGLQGGWCIAAITPLVVPWLDAERHLVSLVAPRPSGDAAQPI
jgi:16S rRNA (guanine527-N7)-methyltransferase